VGPDGFPGARGPDGAPGAKGPVGPNGQAGGKGMHGRVGRAGNAGPEGPRGEDFKYEIAGPSAFSIGLGGDRGLISSGVNGFRFEHSEKACQIRFVQKEMQPGRSQAPAIIAGLNGNLGVGTVSPGKMLHVMDQCRGTDEECANRKGPLLLSASWRNVVMAKVQTKYFDMIGAYTNWAKGVSSIYIGAHDQQALPVTKSFERVYFGGVVGGDSPVARFENFVGKFYATKFVQQVQDQDASDILKNADAFLDVAHTAKSVDLSYTHIALHSKVANHDAELANIGNQMTDLLLMAKGMKAKLQGR